MKGKIPPRYEYLNEKLSGGQGEVFICEDTRLKRKVAIKSVQDVVDIDRLLKEISILQGLRCKHVVEIFDLIREPGSNDVGLVEEYLPGDDLSSLAMSVANGPQIPADKLIRTLYQIACGIAEIHEHGVVHRDIKLNNIKFDEESLLRIFDFGLAKDESDPATIGFKGTFGFAAPELFAEEVKIQSPVDVYAFGICCFVLATGEFPDDAHETPPPNLDVDLAAIRPDLPPDICALLDACLAFDPTERPKMRAVRDLLAEHLVQGRHVGTLCSSSQRFVLQGTGKGVKITAGTLGSARVSYDGRSFNVKEFTGEVYVNNIPATAGMALPGASVLTFGGPERGAGRTFFTFDVSHPEVVL